MADRNTIPVGLTKASLLADTGRELGPDIQLTVVKDPIPTAGGPNPRPIAGATNMLGGLGPLPHVDTLVNTNSSITEILNIVAYLCNPPASRTASEIVANESISQQAAAGAHLPNGFYDNNPGPIGTTLFLATGGQGSQMFNLNNLQTIAAIVNGPDTLPVGIMKREAPFSGYDAGTNGLGQLTTTADVTGLMSDCVKQMINILENTRTIFGPKGWTALFQQVKGGGAGSKHSAKRTHRQHRRRYSSKQY
jgi:hypothetical protein